MMLPGFFRNSGVILKNMSSILDPGKARTFVCFKFDSSIPYNILSPIIRVVPCFHNALLSIVF